MFPEPQAERDRICRPDSEPLEQQLAAALLVALIREPISAKQATLRLPKLIRPKSATVTAVR